MFIFDWFGLKFTGAAGSLGSVSVEGGRNAWGSYGFTDIVLFITALAAIGLALLAASDVEVGLPVALSAIVTALGILSLILVIISIISPPDFGLNVSGTGIDHERKIGVWLGFLAVAAVTVGGYLAMQEEGTSLGSEVDRFRGGGTGGPGAGPSPPSPSPPPSSQPPPTSQPPPPPAEGP
ncbi:MAG: hypothetical protein E6G49_02210 [Actinobacteria bacterium]|nr:MAG: hypothetical protein E6G49_02210 [Actinomycetota bacterium]